MRKWRLVCSLVFATNLMTFKTLNAREQTDDQILKSTKDAVEQARSWNQSTEHVFCMEVLKGDPLARKACTDDYDKAVHDLESRSAMTWAPKVAPNEYEMSNLGSFALVCDTKKENSQCRVAQPPPEILSLILLDQLRLEMTWFAKFNDADGLKRSVFDSPLFLAWKGQWFRTQVVFCRLNPTREYTDLTDAKQSCPSSKSKRESLR